MALPAPGDKPTGAMLRALLASLLTDVAGSAAVATLETTTSTTYTDLATTGPSVTLTSTGTRALILFTYQGFNSTAANGGSASIAVSGATTIAASDTEALGHHDDGTGFGFYAGTFALLNINPGSNTYKMQYRVLGTTGTFIRRRILVIAP